MSIFDAAGNLLANSTVSNRFLFTGREYYREIGLYNYRNRFYSPEWGRFLQPDPIGFSGGDNLYRYCGNNPANLTDPMGTSAPGPWVQHRYGGGSESEPGVSNSSFFGAGGFGAGLISGYDGNAGAGLYVFNQGNMGINRGGGVIYGGPANRNGYSYNGKPVLPGTPVNGTTAAPAVPKVLSAIGNLIGKVWALPNTIIGTVIGIASLPFGGHVDFGHNAMVFSDLPFGRGTLTLGNTTLTTRSSQDLSQNVDTYYTDQYGAAAAIAAKGFYQTNLGWHERGHTYQYQVLGPLFLPAYIFSHPLTAASPFENAADRYGAGAGSWWPGK